MGGQKFLRSTILILLVFDATSLGFAIEVCSNTILPGSKGDPGEVGDTGDEGRLGKTGPAGHTGLMGKNGEKGEAGRMGKTGPVGERGLKGEQGITGPSGLKGKPGSTCDCGRYRKVVGQMDINISKLRNTVKFVKSVILGVKETEKKFYLLVREERKYADAQLNCRLRGGTLAVPENETENAFLGSYISEVGLTHVLVGVQLAQNGEGQQHVENSTVSGASCAQMASDRALSWVECDSAKYYICEFAKNK